MNDELEIEQEDNGEEAVVKIKKLKEDLKQCQKEKQDYLTGWQREKADFINFKRRQEEQMGEWMKMFGEGLIKDILPVMDTLESGIKNQESGGKSADGLAGVKKQLLKILEKHGLEEIKSVGQKFDHNLHEAVEQIEADRQAGEIVEEVQKGYALNGKIIRVAKVKVCK